MLRTSAQGREARDMIEDGGGRAKNRKKPQKSYRRDGENGGDSGGRRKRYRCRPSDISTTEKTQRGICNALRAHVRAVVILIFRMLCIRYTAHYCT